MALRFLSGLVLLAAVVALVSELTRAQLGVPSAPFTSLLSQLTELAPAKVAALQRSMHPLLWDPVVKSLLRLPAWVILGGIGLVLAWLGRRRPQRIDVFTN
jgi:hypothetical protein